MDKLLIGAKAIRLSQERPASFEVTTNLKTAKALGLGIPQFVPTHADRAIR